MRDIPLTISDYQQALADHARLVRKLDGLLNGARAAQQAFLCDIVSQCQIIASRINGPVLDRFYENESFLWPLLSYHYGTGCCEGQGRMGGSDVPPNECSHGAKLHWHT